MSSLESPPGTVLGNQTPIGSGTQPVLSTVPAVQEALAKPLLVEATERSVANQEVEQPWLSYFQQCSRLLVAVIEPATMKLHYANDHLCQLVGLASTGSRLPRRVEELGTALQHLLSKLDSVAGLQLYRRHLLHRLFCDFYGVEPRGSRLLDEAVMVSLRSPLYKEPRCIEFWLRSEHLKITRLDSRRDEFEELGLGQLSLAELEATLVDPQQLEQLEHKLDLKNYRVEGLLLLEGVDVTEREAIQRITQLLIDRDSILRPQKFHEVDQALRSLFRAQNTVILTIEGEQTRLFMGSVSADLDTRTYSLESLRHSHFLRAVNSNRVVVVTDLASNYNSECGQQLAALGVRSLLLIPLVTQPDPRHPSTEPPPAIGLVGIMSNQPQAFDGLDCRYAEQLIPAFAAALTTAQRQLVQQRFITNIHPAVEWRFLQEAERRSLGLPGEPIVFTGVYPLYGISDIRGSSNERNRAIQADLLEQFRLALAVVEAFCQIQETALANQLRLDLVEHIRLLEQKITVDAEVTGLRYLKEQVEAHFDYFGQTGEVVQRAIATYQAACDNPQQAVYRARASYDAGISRINALLREIWDKWQLRMQQISPHYCDVESTDGIDHMIYAGESIYPGFGRFHLLSLRYEQLRAMCDCARATFSLQGETGTELQVAHLILVQDATVDIFHDETNERLFDVRGTRDTRYEIVKKRIDKAVDDRTQMRVTQPGTLAIVYSTEEEWHEYQQYFRYLHREGWINNQVERGNVQPLQGVDGLKYARVKVLPEQRQEP